MHNTRHEISLIRDYVQWCEKTCHRGNFLVYLGLVGIWAGDQCNRH
jgi:hypothetical protein